MNTIAQIYYCLMLVLGVMELNSSFAALEKGQHVLLTQKR